MSRVRDTIPNAGEIREEKVSLIFLDKKKNQYSLHLNQVLNKQTTITSSFCIFAK